MNVPAVDADPLALDALPNNATARQVDAYSATNPDPWTAAQWRTSRQGLPWPGGAYRRETKQALADERAETPQESHDREHERPQGWDYQ